MFGLTRRATKAPGKPTQLRVLASTSGLMVGAMRADGAQTNCTKGECTRGRMDACMMANIMTTKNTAWAPMCGQMGNSTRDTGKMGKCTDRADLQTRQERAELECGLTENVWSGCQVL